MTSGSAAVPIATASVKTTTKRGKVTPILRFLVRARRQRRVTFGSRSFFQVDPTQNKIDEGPRSCAEGTGAALPVSFLYRLVWLAIRAR